MVERISQATRYAMLVADMKTNMYNYNKLTAQLSSGKKITSISDDPVNAVNVLNTNKQLGQISTFQTNIGVASAELDALGQVMEIATGYLSTAWDKAVQANNQTYTGNSLKALKTEIDEIAKTMVDLANTEYNDNYLFSGARTKTLAYEIDEETGNIIYQGTPASNPDYARKTEVADGVFETINTTGDKVFGWYIASPEETADGKKVFTDKEGNKVIQTVDEQTGDKTYAYEDGTPYTGEVSDLSESMVEDYSGVMGALRKLSNSIQKVLDGNTDEGYEEMNATLDMFKGSLDTITNEQTKFGGIANRLEMSDSALTTNNENLTAYLTEINEVDYAEAVTAWINAQYAYQASLQVSAASMNLSLLNYIN